MKLFPKEMMEPSDTADKPVPLPETETPLRWIVAPKDWIPTRLLAANELLILRTAPLLSAQKPIYSFPDTSLPDTEIWLPWTAKRPMALLSNREPLMLTDTVEPVLVA